MLYRLKLPFMVYHFKKTKFFFLLVTFDFDRPISVGLSWPVEIFRVWYQETIHNTKYAECDFESC